MFGVLFPNAALTFMPESGHSRTILLIPSVKNWSPSTSRRTVVHWTFFRGSPLTAQRKQCIYPA